VPLKIAPLHPSETPAMTPEWEGDH